MAFFVRCPAMLGVRPGVIVASDEWHHRLNARFASLHGFVKVSPAVACGCSHGDPLALRVRDTCSLRGSAGSDQLSPTAKPIAFAWDGR